MSKLQEQYDELLNENYDILKENERLCAENEKLRAALKPFADAAPHYCICNEHDDWFVDGEYITIGDLRAAAAALKETGE